MAENFQADPSLTIYVNGESCSAQRLNGSIFVMDDKKVLKLGWLESLIKEDRVLRILEHNEHTPSTYGLVDVVVYPNQMIKCLLKDYVEGTSIYERGMRRQFDGVFFEELIENVESIQRMGVSGIDLGVHNILVHEKMPKLFDFNFCEIKKDDLELFEEGITKDRDMIHSLIKSIATDEGIITYLVEAFMKR
ncbi:MAG: hypothetical protein GOU97_01945 [Nanoarchaeota archaeon]|nr:hypothetical protein [Nanoarchaeota archaeon]